MEGNPETHLMSHLKMRIPEVDKEIMTFKSDGQKVEPLSAFDLLSKTGDSSVSNRNSAMCDVDSSPVTLTGYKYKKDGLSENKLFPEVEITETTKDTKVHNLKVVNDAGFSETPKNLLNERKEEMISDADSEDTSKYQTYVDSTKSFFFRISGLAYHSAVILSSLISYYVLNAGDKEDHFKTSNSSCGASFCSIDKEGFSNSIKELPDETRYLLIGIGLECGIVAPLLVLLFLDSIVKTTKDVKLSWDHVFATIKYMKKKDQLLIIPFTISGSLCRGFYAADFAKAYIACAWNISLIGLITVVYGAASALSSLFSGVMIKYVGRRSVMVLCRIINIANLVFLFLWSPSAQQPYIFYVQGGIFGIISGIFHSQTKGRQWRFSAQVLEAIASFLENPGGLKAHSFTPSLTFDEIYSIRKNKDLKTWRVPPSHDWYKRSSPGGSIGLACDRADQTALSRFVSGHLRSCSFSHGNKVFPVCAKCGVASASPEHILSCLRLSRETFETDPLLALDFLRVSGIMDGV
ncbi:UNC93-like protein [Araneus ventricosus]|uniref:UNC93-like protein n=1 Tax=Araneus ventricosus TaxID=182803 RepID=A0A4Y2X0T4_ARAVE|nr:UNC93-like protein [Araneus ventricosus]